MKIFIAIILLVSLCSCNLAEADYLPVTEAHTTLEQIKIEQEKFKDLIDKNVTLDFNNCVDLVKTQECNLVDQWQSEIEKYKLENDNSVNVEVPFLKERKAKKVLRLKQLIEAGEKFDKEMLVLVEQLKVEQADFQTSSWEIHQMYKLPEETQIELLEKKKQIDVVHELNANIPKVAEDEVNTARNEYDLGEISIQAQTVSEEMLSAYNKLDSAMSSLKQAFDMRQKEIQKEKDQIKEDITRLRALIDNEFQVQNQNQAKIGELNGKVSACETLPKNTAKDCGPIKIRASKMQTEMNILETRTELLFKEIERLMKENQNEEQVNAQKDSVKAMQDAAALRRQEMSYVVDEADPMAGISTQPTELKPKNHLKEKVN